MKIKKLKNNNKLKFTSHRILQNSKMIKSNNKCKNKIFFKNKIKMKKVKENKKQSY